MHRTARAGEVYPERIALRVDDIGASTKRYQIYSDLVLKLGPLTLLSGNWLFLKYLQPFRKWGPYQEMTSPEWVTVLDLLERFDAKMTVAITAAWVESESTLVSFPEKFPSAAATIKDGLHRGLLEIANHGLTHCVVECNAFRSKWFSSNRIYHREFWPWVPPQVQEDHIRRSQDILQAYFQTEIVTFVPPGNVFTNDTLDIACKYGLRYVSCNTPRRLRGEVAVLGDDEVLPFHDRDIVLNGVDWLKRILEEQAHKRFCFVRDLGKEYGTGRPEQKQAAL